MPSEYGSIVHIFGRFVDFLRSMPNLVNICVDDIRDQAAGMGKVKLMEQNLEVCDD